MKRFFTLIILCTLIYACKPGVPKNIIQPDEMEKVLLDIHIVDGYVSSLSLQSQDTSKFVAAPLYRGVYNKFGIDSALYIQSLNYYYKHPAVLKKMYDSISVKLNVLKEQTAKLLDVDENDFKNVFEKSKDSSQIDQTLNHKYNYKYLMRDRYGNIYNEKYFSAPVPSAPGSVGLPLTPNPKEPIPVPQLVQ